MKKLLVLGLLLVSGLGFISCDYEEPITYNSCGLIMTVSKSGTTYYVELNNQNGKAIVYQVDYKNYKKTLDLTKGIANPNINVCIDYIKVIVEHNINTPPKDEPKPKVYDENEIYFVTDFNDEGHYPKVTNYRIWTLNGYEMTEANDGYYDTKYTPNVPVVRNLTKTSNVGLAIKLGASPIKSNIEIYRFTKDGQKVILGSGYTSSLIIPNVEYK